MLGGADTGALSLRPGRDPSGRRKDKEGECGNNEIAGDGRIINPCHTTLQDGTPPKSALQGNAYRLLFREEPCYQICNKPSVY